MRVSIAVCDISKLVDARVESKQVSALSLIEKKGKKEVNEHVFVSSRRRPTDDEEMRFLADVRKCQRAAAAGRDGAGRGEAAISIKISPLP